MDGITDLDFNRANFNRALRWDFSAFVARAFRELYPGTLYLPSWHIDFLAHQFENIERGMFNRLIINIAPRSLKSTIATVCYPAWRLGRKPSLQVLACSYNENLSKKHSRDCRRLLLSTWYQQAFPWTRIDPNKSSETEFETTMGGYRLATSIDGSSLGRGADILIIDDPCKPEDVQTERRRQINATYDSTLHSRLNDKEKSEVILVMQRLHEQDLTGHLREKGGFEHICLPAIAIEDTVYDLGYGHTYQRKKGEALHPNRESLLALARIRQTIGEMNYRHQYQQEAIPAEGRFFKRKSITREDYTKCGPAEFTIQSWDVAAKTGERNDYSACTTIYVYKGKRYVGEVIRDRWEILDLCDKVIQHAAYEKPNAILIEDTSSGSALIQMLKTQTTLPVVGITPKFDKESRIAIASGEFKTGRAILPIEAPWLFDLEYEMFGFPDTRYDDQVDSLAQGLIYLQEIDCSRPIAVAPLDNWAPSYWLDQGKDYYEESD